MRTSELKEILVSIEKIRLESNRDNLKKEDLIKLFEQLGEISEAMLPKLKPSKEKKDIESYAYN